MCVNERGKDIGLAAVIGIKRSELFDSGLYTAGCGSRIDQAAQSPGIVEVESKRTVEALLRIAGSPARDESLAGFGESLAGFRVFAHPEVHFRDGGINLDVVRIEDRDLLPHREGLGSSPFGLVTFSQYNVVRFCFFY